MRIGINALFLEKRGTGIGQVTESVLMTLGEFPEAKQHEWLIYVPEPVNDPFLQNFTVRVLKPRWKRKDVLRLYIWERWQLPKAAKRDRLDGLISLYQSPTALPRHQQHTMIVHDLIPELYPEYQRNWRQYFYWLSTKSAIQRADHIVAVSKSTREDILKLFPLLKTSVSVAYPGLPLSFQHAIPESTSFPEGEYIYHGGGLEIRKNTETLLEAYQALRKERQAAGQAYPKLVLSGKVHTEDNSLAFPIKSYLKEHGLEDDVSVLGFVSSGKLKALYQHAKFFVYPSVYEGFGLPVLEALSVGTPTIASHASALHEVAGEAALYFRPEDTAMLHRLMRELDTDAALREKLHEAGPVQARQFTWSEFVRKLLQTVVQ